MPGPNDFQRTTEDAVTFFRLRALFLAPQMGVALAQVDEAVAIVVGALGREWLIGAADDVPPATPLALRRHPLGDMISTAGTTQVAECLELAAYLRELAMSPQLGEVIAGLKSQYRQTLLQLATAARLQLAGATGVSLEPPALDGRLSDVAFSYTGRRFRAECYRPTVTAQREVREEMLRVGQACVAEVRDRPHVYAVAVAFTDAPTAAIRREARRVVRRLADEVDAVVTQHSDDIIFPAFTATGPWGVVSVTRALPTPKGAPPILLRPDAFPQQGDDPDVFMRTGYLTQREAAGVGAAPPASVGLSHVGIWLPPAVRADASADRDLEQPLAKLGRKIERKLAQARNDEEAERVAVVETWMTSQLDRVNPEHVERLRRKVVDAHDGVAALLLVHRDWTPALGRHGYTVRVLQPSARPGLPADLVTRLAALDGRRA